MVPFKACIFQTTSGPFDKAGNLQRALTAMEEARVQGADLLLFPEMFLTGYMVRKQLPELSEPVDGPSFQALREKAKALNLGVIMGAPVLDASEKPHNALVMIDRDGSVPAVVKKTHMFGGEEIMFEPGNQHKAFDTSFGRMGVLVCYDLEFPETARSLTLDGAEILCMCAANMSPFEDYHMIYARARAMENMVHTLYCNYVGDEKRFHYCGQSCAYDPAGKPLAEADMDSETMLFFDVDPAAREWPLRDLNYLEHRRKELYHADLL